MGQQQTALMEKLESAPILMKLRNNGWLQRQAQTARMEPLVRALLGRLLVLLR